MYFEIEFLFNFKCQFVAKLLIFFVIVNHFNFQWQFLAKMLCFFLASNYLEEIFLKFNLISIC